MRRRPAARILALVAAVGLVASGCGDDEEEPGAEATTTTAGPTSVDLWVARFGEAEISRYDPDDGALAGRIPLVSGPRDLATGEGALWASVDTGEVVAIDAATNQVRGQVDVGASPALIVAGEGAVWVTDEEGRDLVEIDPAAEAVVSRVNVGTETERIAGMAVGEGALWLVVEPTFGLVKIDPATAEESARLSLCGAEECRFGAVAVGDGVVWVIDDFTGELVSVDPESVTETGRTKLGAEGALRDIAFGPEGLWILDAEAGRALEIDPADPRIQARSEDAFEDPINLTLGLGSVWLYGAGSGELARIDADTGATADTIEVSDVGSFVVGCCEP